MSLNNILGHYRCRNDVVLEACIGIGFRNTAENPEKVFAEIFLGLHTNTARSIARNESLYLNMNKLRSCDVTAQDVSIRCIAEGDNRRVAAATKLTGNEELACVTPATFFFFGHDGFESLTCCCAAPAPDPPGNVARCPRRRHELLVRTGRPGKDYRQETQQGKLLFGFSTATASPEDGTWPKPV